MKFREDLPQNCPPQNTNTPLVTVLWRMVSENQAVVSDFDSHMKKFPNKNYPDKCRASSISLMTSLEHCRAVLKLKYMNAPNFTHAAQVRFDASAGVWDQNKEGHVSLWLYGETDPLSLTTGIVEVLK